MHIAAYGGLNNVAELLIAKGANVNAKDRGGWTPLHMAILYNRKAMAELLRQHGGHE